MANFNIGLPGNSAADYIAGRGPMPADEAKYLALMAVAFELRTANILAAQATPDWLNQARVRMGHEPFPPQPTVAHQCEAWTLRENADGGRYCAACGKEWEPPQ